MRTSPDHRRRSARCHHSCRQGETASTTTFPGTSSDVAPVPGVLARVAAWDRIEGVSDTNVARVVSGAHKDRLKPRQGKFWARPKMDGRIVGEGNMVMVVVLVMVKGLEEDPL